MCGGIYWLLRWSAVLHSLILKDKLCCVNEGRYWFTLISVNMNHTSTIPVVLDDTIRDAVLFFHSLSRQKIKDIMIYDRKQEESFIWYWEQQISCRDPQIVCSMISFTWNVIKFFITMTCTAHYHVKYMSKDVMTDHDSNFFVKQLDKNDVSLCLSLLLYATHDVRSTQREHRACHESYSYWSFIVQCVSTTFCREARQNWFFNSWQTVMSCHFANTTDVRTQDTDLWSVERLVRFGLLIFFEHHSACSS